MFTPARVYFSLRHGDLVIRVQHKDTNDLLQLVPPDKLRGDLPIVLVEGHVHWLNLSTSIIEIRPLKNIWEQSDENWRIDCADGKYRVYKDGRFLVDIRSQTWAMVSSLLKGLDPPEGLVVTTSATGVSSAPRLSVALPRHGLSFFVNSDGDLESDDFKEMVYDENQDIGTLFGLVDRLVLRAKTVVEEGLVPRCVLIPRHPYTTRGGLLEKFSYSSGTYDVYKVDTELGCLKGNSSWESKYLLSHLHARTSIDWAADSLTSRTGAQEALSILRCAGWKSLQPREVMHLKNSLELPWYPQIGIAQDEEHMTERYPFLRQRARRAAYLFSSNDTTSTFPGDCNDMEPVSPLPGPRLEDTRVVLKLREILRVLREALPVSSPCSFLHPQFMLGESSGTPRVSHTTFSRWQPLSAGHSHFLHPSLASQDMRQRSWCPITLELLLSTRDVPALPQPTNLSRYNSDGDKYSSGTPAFDRLLSSLPMTEGGPRFQDRYIAHLHSSARHVHEEYQTTCTSTVRYPIEELKKHFVECRRKWMDASGRLKDSLSAMTANPLEQTLAQCGQWPLVMTYSLLGCLASTSLIKLSENWKTCLVQFALLLLELQRARRLLQFALAGLEEEFSKELENEGCEGWDADQYPDWLLIQVCLRSMSVHI